MFNLNFICFETCLKRQNLVLAAFVFKKNLIVKIIYFKCEIYLQLYIVYYNINTKGIRIRDGSKFMKKTICS